MIPVITNWCVFTYGTTDFFELKSGHQIHGYLKDEEICTEKIECIDYKEDGILVKDISGNYYKLGNICEKYDQWCLQMNITISGTVARNDGENED